MTHGFASWSGWIWSNLITFQHGEFPTLVPVRSMVWTKILRPGGMPKIMGFRICPPSTWASSRFQSKKSWCYSPKGEPQHGGIFSFGRRSPLVATRKAQVNSSVKSCNLQKASYVTSFGFCLRMSLVYHLLPLYIYIHSNAFTQNGCSKLINNDNQRVASL